MDEAATIEKQQWEQQQMELQQARQADLEEESVLIGSIAQRVATKLNATIEAGHDTIAFTILILLSLFKDGPMDWMLDFVGVGELPLLGQMPGALVTATIWIFVRMRSNLLTRHFRKRVFLLIFDLFPLLNNLPLTTAGIVWMWYDARKNADQAEADLGDLKNKTQEQLKAIDEAI